MRSGRVLKGYTILHRLGKGGMGEAWSAVDTNGKGVVIKCRATDELLPARVDDLKSRLRREGKILLTLRHDGIVSALDWFEDGEEIYLVLERIDGVPFGDWLNTGPSLLARLAILRQVVDAVSYAHGQGVIHRDLKPGNILVTAGLRAKVLDFGLARALDSTRLTRSREAIGTISYMAPEQARALNADERADVFSLGMIFAQTLGLQEPFRYAATSRLMYQTLLSPAPVVLDRWLPHDVRFLLEALLEKDRNKRSSLAALHAHLGRLIEEGPALENRLREARLHFETGSDSPVLEEVDLPEVSSLLDDLVARRAARKGGTLFVLGPPGSGKTAVLKSLGEQFRLAGMKTFEEVFAEASKPHRIPWEYLLERSAGQSHDDTLSQPRTPEASDRAVEEFLAVAKKDAGSDGVVLLLDDLHLAQDLEYGWIERYAHLATDCPAILVLSGDSSREGAGNGAHAYWTFLTRAKDWSNVRHLALSPLTLDQVLKALAHHELPLSEAHKLYEISAGNPALVNLLLAHRHAGLPLEEFKDAAAPYLLDRLRARYLLVDGLTRRTMKVLVEAGGTLPITQLAEALGTTELALDGRLQDLEVKHGWVKRTGSSVRVTHPWIRRVVGDSDRQP